MIKTKILYYPSNQVTYALHSINKSIREIITRRGGRVKNVNNNVNVNNSHLYDFQDETIITKELDDKVQSLLSLVRNLKLHLKSELSYVTALTLDKSTVTINKDGSKDKNLIVSLCLILGFMNLEEKTSFLKKQSLLGTVVIIIISIWGLQGSSVGHDTVYFKDSLNRSQGVIFMFLDYSEFFGSLNILLNFKFTQELGDVSELESENITVSPIFIFKDLHWSNILLLFKQNGYSVHGGSITRRHKLSISERRLARFMDIFEYNLDKNSFYTSYIDKVLTANTYDKNIFENFKNNKEIFANDNVSREYLDFVRLNAMSYLYYHLMRIKKEYKKNQDELKGIKNTLEVNKDVITSYKKTIEVKENKLKMSMSISSEKHKSAVKGRLKNLKVEYYAKLDELKNLRIKYDSLLQDVYRDTEDLDSIRVEMDDMTSLLNTIWGEADQGLDSEESSVVKLTKNNTIKNELKLENKQEVNENYLNEVKHYEKVN